MDTSDEWIRSRTGIGTALRDAPGRVARRNRDRRQPHRARARRPQDLPSSTRSSSARSPRSTGFRRSPARFSTAWASCRSRPSTSPPPARASCTRSRSPTRDARRRLQARARGRRRRALDDGRLERSRGLGAVRRRRRRGVMVSEPGKRGVLGEPAAFLRRVLDLLSVRATGVRARSTPKCGARPTTRSR